MDTPMWLGKPPAIAALPVNKAGHPIPWFVDRDCDIDGQPDFRVMDPRKMRDAVRFKLCWVCGGRRGRFGSFVVGPMCAINRVSAEPPSHQECAVFSAQQCPFLSTPNMVRRERHLPENYAEPAGVMIKRNPGVTLVHTSTTFKVVQHETGPLWDIGDPVARNGMLWFARSRTANPDEIMASIDTGLPIVLAAAERDGPAAVADVRERYAALAALVAAE